MPFSEVLTGRNLRGSSSQNKCQIEGCNNQSYGGKAQADEFMLLVEAAVHVLYRKSII